MAIEADKSSDGVTWTDMFGNDVNEYILSIAVAPLYNMLILDGASLEFTGGIGDQFVHAVCVKDAVEGNSYAWLLRFQNDDLGCDEKGWFLLPEDVPTPQRKCYKKFGERAELKDASTICSNAGAKLPLPKNEQEARELSSTLSSFRRQFREDFWEWGNPQPTEIIAIDARQEWNNGMKWIDSAGNEIDPYLTSILKKNNNEFMIMDEFRDFSTASSDEIYHIYCVKDYDPSNIAQPVPITTSSQEFCKSDQHTTQLSLLLRLYG